MNIPLDSLDWPEIIEDADDELYVADLGCGTADYHPTLETAVSTLASQYGYEGDIMIFGIEADPEKVELARENNPGEQFQYINKKLEPGESYTTIDGEFDAVISQHLMCETDNPVEVNNEAERLGKKTCYNQIHTTC